MAGIIGDDVLEQMGVDIADELCARGLEKSEAMQIATDATEKVRQLYGGHAVYFPKGLSKSWRARDLAIFGAFDGTNYAALATQYELSEMRIRQIIGCITEERRQQRGKLGSVEPQPHTTASESSEKRGMQ